MRKNLKTDLPDGINIVRVPQTAEHKVATEKMLATPCPYCSDPAAHQRPLKGKGRKDHDTLVARMGKFWRRDDGQGMIRVSVYDHNDYFRMSFDSEHFIPRFKDFRLEVINFPAPYSPFFWASYGLLFLIDAAPSDLERRNKFGLNVTRLTHRNGPVAIDAHTWFSHGSILTVHHLPRKLSSADVTAMRDALEFFRPEERGAPKINDADVFQAITFFGLTATQAEVAKRLGVGERTLRDWLKRVGWSWERLKQEYLSGNIV